MNANLFILLLTVVAVALAHAQSQFTPAAEADRIVNLPGAENLPVTSFGFSGYLSINGTDGTLTKQQHYWYQEAQSNPEKAPLVFWTNGGPGCSGLLGAMSEQGLFLTESKDSTLTLNPYSWSRIAHMVYIEQPCGVGFSYSTAADTKADYTANDASAAVDNYNLIQAFLVRYPQFAKTPLYLSSESYGGHYLPTLSKLIVDMNSQGLNPRLNFKGFALGNPATTQYSITPAMIETMWDHQLISRPVWSEFQAKCIDERKIRNVQACEDLFLQINEKVRDLNPYALDYPTCLSDSSGAIIFRGQAGTLLRYALHQFSQNTKLALGLSDEQPYEPCADDYMTTYLNRADVKAALHVNSEVKWADCSRSIHYAHMEVHQDMTPYYKYLLNPSANYDLDILVYSGDDDSVCATIGTQSWIYDLGFAPQKGKDWASWKTPDGEFAGYMTKFQGARFAFATVHDAGHEVPTYKPQAAFELFSNFLSGSLTSDE